MLEALLLLGVDLVLDLERRRLALVEDGGLFDEELDRARRQVGVALGLLLAVLRLVHAAVAHLAAHADHPLGAQLVGEAVDLGLRVEDELGDSVAVAEIDEEEAAHVAAALHPAEEHGLLADVSFAQGAAGVGSLELVDETRHGSCLLVGCGT